MDFPGGNITNIRVIDGFSSIYWRIYTEEPGITNHPSEAPNNGHTILKHLSRLKDLELRLRNLDCLASCYPRRLGLWVFSATPNFDNLAPLCLNEGKDEPNRLLVGSTSLKVSASGNVTSRELVRNLSADPQALGVNPAGPQRPQNAPNPPRRMDGYGSSAAIYASFISAVTGALSLQLVRRHGAIPLGSRTHFTAVERDGYESPRIANNSPTSIPSLTTLQVQLTPVGKLTAALQTVSQHGLTRLHSPKDNPGEIPDVQPGTDIWLSPNGTIARLVSSKTNSRNEYWPNPPTMWASGTGDSSDVSAVRSIQWKKSVLEWLESFGLSVDSRGEESWVEVEVWEPFYARLAGEIWRQNEESPSAFPLKRILWPARYCFRRTKSILLGSSSETENDCCLADNPLELAENWRVTGKPALDQINPITPSGFQEQESKVPEIWPFKTEFSEGIGSLSRIAQYPELQPANLVYPTPPDGATTMNADYADLPLPQTQQENGSKSQEQAPSKGEADSDIAMDFGPSAGLTVGSGRYDMNGDDDLFGEMNDRDFGSRGITDADFSFFDDPEFENMGGAQAENIQEMPDIAEVSLEEAEEQSAAENGLLDTNAMEPEQVDAPQTDSGDQTAGLPQEREPSAVHIYSPHGNSQPISPPLSPVEVKKILFPGSDEGDHDSSAAKRERKQSHYNPVSFKQNIGDWNQKYGAEGRFWFTTTGTNTSTNSVNSASDIPTIGLPRRNKGAHAINSPAKATDGHSVLSGGVRQRSLSTSDSSSISSDDDSDEIISGKDQAPVTFATRKRKRDPSIFSNSAAQTPDRPPIDNSQEVPVNKIEDSTFIGNFLSAFSDWSLLGYFSVSQNQLPSMISRKEEQIQVAQLLVDQITQSSLDHKLDGRVGLFELENEVYPLRTFLEETSFMGETERLDLKSYASLQNGAFSPSASDGLTPRQLPQRKESPKGSISKLSAPHLRIRRGRDYLEALPPIVSFWETFDLEPSHGSKDISAYCIHPQVAAEAADTFLERLGLLYSSCNLGNHVRGDRSMVFEHGLGSWDTDSSEASGYFSSMQSLRALCEELGSALSNGLPSTESFVIYVINPFTHAAALADICAAFSQLSQKYAAGTDKQHTGQLNELVLQIIPISFVMSPASVVVPPQSEYLSLALEVYSRCPPKDPVSSMVYCAPPVLLAEPSPRVINFKLSPERLSPLQDGKSLHVACSKSLDQRWITVAWSDNTGALQRTMSYCLRFRNSSAVRSILDVRNEIWAATKTIIDTIQTRWRIVIVNTEPVDQEELDTWTNLAEQHNKTKPIPLELIVLHINATADLFLEPPPLMIPMSVFNPQASSTPVATPNPGASSPEQSGIATTPTGGGNAISASTPEVPPEAESEYILTDVHDESWGVVLSHRLNSSPHLTEYRPALSSGYLIRRKGPTDGDGVFAMNINLVYTQRPPPSYEILLKEIFGMYYDLAVLARIRGTHCVQRNTLPWHIATAIRAQELLSYVF